MMSVLFVFDLLGVFAFGLSGAWLATRRDFDLVGIVALSFVTGLAGGITRDVLVGDVPPLAMTEQAYLLVPVLAAMVVLAAPRLVRRFERPVLVLDAIGLGIFAAVGAAKAIDAGLGVWASTMVGVIAAVGGGILRDLFAGVVPQIFGRGSELYAIPAALGAFTVALMWEPTGGSGALIAVATVGTLTLRLLAVRFGWHAPGARRRSGTPANEARDGD